MSSRHTAFALTVEERYEHDLQIDCTAMLERLLLPSVQWTAIDHAHSLDPTLGRNGRPIGFGEAKKRKARGCKAGICDYLFWHRAEAFAIELKRSASERLSEDQKKFIRGLLGAGCDVQVCWSIWQVEKTCTDWGLMRPHQVMA